jgi:cell division protein FtsL
VFFDVIQFAGSVKLGVCGQKRKEITRIEKVTYSVLLHFVIFCGILGVIT